MQLFGYLQVLCMFAAHHGLIAGSEVVDNQCVFRTDDDGLDHVPFDNVTHICCEKGVEYKIQNGTELECCGGMRKFQPSIEVCCNDTVYLKNSMKDYRICKKDNVLGNDDFSPKDQSYPANTDVCCGKIVQKRLILNLSERWLKKLGRLQPINVNIHIAKVNLFTKSKPRQVNFHLVDSTGFSTASLKSKCRKFFKR
ncbi:uncharacterized protein LOC111102343 [Crassostrea virginica]